MPAATTALAPEVKQSLSMLIETFAFGGGKGQGGLQSRSYDGNWAIKTTGTGHEGQPSIMTIVVIDLKELGRQCVLNRVKAIAVAVGSDQEFTSEFDGRGIAEFKGLPIGKYVITLKDALS